MKFLYRFSLFFLIAATFFSIGLYAKDIINYAVPKEPSSEASKEAAAVDFAVTGDTVYIVESYDLDNEITLQEEEAMPPLYLGLTRQRLEEEIQVYSDSPSLTDLQKGFISAKLISFSPDKIVVRKNFQMPEEAASIPAFFYLVAEDNYVTVYESDLKTVYLQTDIEVEDLPEEVQTEIINMKYMGNESELYNFLESYSS